VAAAAFFLDGQSAIQRRSGNLAVAVAEKRVDVDGGNVKVSQNRGGE